MAPDAGNQSIAPMKNMPHLGALSSDKSLSFGKSVPTDEPMRTKAPWRKVGTVHEDFHEFTQTGLDDSDSQHIEKALQKVRAEAEEERRLDPELDAIPEKVYKDVDRFLRAIYKSDYGAFGRIASLAEIMPLNNGEIGIELREGQKIFTLSFGGDEHIVFAGIFSEESQARGILTFSTPHLFAIIDMISSLYP